MINSIEQAALQIAHLTALSRDEPIKTDIGTVVETNKNGVKTIRSAVNRMNSLGYIPIASIGVGGCRIFINLIGVIKNIAMAIFLQQSPIESFKNLGNNIAQIVRGVVEIVPILGNLTIYTIDQIRIKVIEYQIKQKSQNQETREYYANGRLVSEGGIIDSYQQDFSFMCQAGVRFA